jgi:formylglycine-generating enzyme required for sulfatase activity
MITIDKKEDLLSLRPPLIQNVVRKPQIQNEMKIFRLFGILFVLGISSCYSNRIVSDKTLHDEYVILDEEKNIYYSKYEVTNAEYRLFLSYLKVEESDEFQKCNVDSLGWSEYSGTLKSFERNYGWHPAFNDYPVVNIPIYGAKKYCEWLSKIRNEPSTLFRLPIESEFKELLNTAEVILLSDSPDDYNCPNFNLSYKSRPELDGGFAMVISKHENNNPKYWYIQNSKGATNIVGNVSEYLDDGQSSGGSWNSYPSEVYNVNQYNGPSAEIGFRVWMVKND